ncbi:endonuclease exonuclease phosphatase family protein [Hordeum vulgare]|nr:endonuclease exonuclease phosphatase family protein [Hordeum vulgare]
MVPASIIESQIARRCLVQTHWKWEAMQHGKDAYLVSFPSFEDLDRVDGVEMNVPSLNAQITISALKYEEIPHKLELRQVWVHVNGVPHTVRHFLGLWAVGTLMAKTLDVDLVSLRRRGIVQGNQQTSFQIRILSHLFCLQINGKERDDDMDTSEHATLSSNM